MITSRKSALFLLCLAVAAVLRAESEPMQLNRATGTVYQVNRAEKSLVFLTQLGIDPQTKTEQSSYKIYWHDQTKFQKRSTPGDFAGLPENSVVRLDCNAENSALAQQGKSFRASRAIIMPAGTAPRPRGWINREKTGMLAVLTAAEGAGGKVQLEGQEISFKIPPRVISRLEAGDDSLLQEAITRARLTGESDGEGKFVCSSIELTPLPDPRLSDVPGLPRVLVIGDSISMNYHEAAKAALQGKVNYHRIIENSGDSAKGAASFQFWFGDTTVKGMHWDAVVINHGLHDLKQKEGEKHQIEPADYSRNLEKIFQQAVSKNIPVIWCTTTPVPGTSTGATGRRQDEDLLYNRTAAAVLQKFPLIAVCDLNKLVRESAVFDEWRKGSNVHFKDAERVALGQKVAEAILQALPK